MSPGFEIRYEYQSSKKIWKTAKLYEKVGLVIGEESPSFCGKIDGKSKTNKYGYRRLFKSEDPDKLEDKYKLSDVVKSGEFTNYNYILTSRNFELMVTNILRKINSDGKGLEEERIRELLEEVKNDMIKEINVLKKQIDGDKDLIYSKLENMEVNLESLKIDEYLKQYIEEDKKEHEKTRELMQANRQEDRESFKQWDQKHDNYHVDIMRGQDEIKEEVKKQTERVINEIYGRTVKRRVWFEMKEPVKSFVGREDQLKDLHEQLQIKRGQVVISQTAAITGLGGIGKSELARKYAYEHKEDYYNVIWISAKTEDLRK